MTGLDSALLVLSGVLVLAVIVEFYLARSYYSKWQTKQTQAYKIGGAQVRGDLYQLLGTFASLDQYEQVLLLSSTSKQGSLDLLGLAPDELHFIEIKKKGTALQGPERKIKRLVDEKKVRYVIKDVELPDGFQMEDRPGRAP